MSLLDTLRSAVKIADNVTKSIQETVSFEKCTSSTSRGDKSFDNGAVELKVIVELKKVQERNANGVLVTISRTSLIFLDVAALAAATNGEGLSNNDKITRSDGSTSPIIDIRGVVDAGTAQPLATEVILG